MTSVWEALSELSLLHQILFGITLIIAFGFEFINGFHDTANAVTTVIYTKTLRPTPAVIYSGICNFLGVLLGGTAIAFSIVNLLPVDLLVDSASTRSVVMVVSLLLAGVIWNLVDLVVWAACFELPYLDRVNSGGRPCEQFDHQRQHIRSKLVDGHRSWFVALDLAHYWLCISGGAPFSDETVHSGAATLRSAE